VSLWTPPPGGGWVALFFCMGRLPGANVGPPATVAVMSAVPEAKAGVGSAMNDVNRQVAGALGVAVIGSVSSSLYSAKLDPPTTGLPRDAAHTATDSIRGAAA